MSNSAIHRITKELTNIQKACDLSLAVACRDSDVRSLRALIIGPPDTPYEFGFFEFDVKFPKDYPLKSPHVKCITTNGGRTRFNPNIYAEGKVCLSILGTWRGNPGEEWSSAQGLESVLISVQSLMSVNPYENEPGYETSKADQDMPKAYIAKTRHETLRISVIQRLEGLLNITSGSHAVVEGDKVGKKESTKPGSPPPQSPFNGSGSTDPSTPASGSSTPMSAYEYDAEATYLSETTPFDPFTDLIKRRFLWYYSSYLLTISKAQKEIKDGTHFKRMEFEYPPSNSMEGTFNYKSLKSRLERIRAALDSETESWAQQGAEEVRKQSQLAVQLKFQCEQLGNQYKSSKHAGSRMEFCLADSSNPFVWDLTLLGRPSTNLDGGVFDIKLHFSPRFPDEQPRVVLQTPIFHQRVSSDGVLCYFPEKPDEVASHLEAIGRAIEDEKPSYDPRTMVNPEAAELCWGGDEKAKVYRRKLRRSAQESYLELDPHEAKTEWQWVLLTLCQRLAFLTDYEMATGKAFHRTA